MVYASDTALIATPIGTLRISGDADRVTAIAIDPAGAAERESDAAAIREAIQQLRAYFAGLLDRFDLPLAPAGTPRGGELRAALQSIPIGETMTYGTLAARSRSSARAIGGVCRTNPFPIVVPCHRVVSAGPIEYYSAGSGPPTKAWLLAHERRRRMSWDR